VYYSGRGKEVSSGQQCPKMWSELGAREDYAA